MSTHHTPHSTLQQLQADVQNSPYSVTLQEQLADELRLVGEFEAAIEHYQLALYYLAQPSANLHNKLGVCHAQQKKWDQAVFHYQTALEQLTSQETPLSLAIYNNLAEIYYERRELEQAKTYLQQITRINPHYINAYQNLSLLCEEENQPREGLVYCEKILQIQPDHVWAHRHKAAFLLKTGQFTAGWVEYRWRNRGTITSPSAETVPAPLPLLPGNLLGQTVLLHKEQGLGDELFFLRFAPLLKKRGAQIIYHGSPKLVTLLTPQPCLEHFLTTSPFPKFDHELFIGDLPYALGITQETPTSLSFTVDVERLTVLQRQLRALGPPPYLGLTWRAGTVPEQQPKTGKRWLYKEIPLPELASALRSIPGTVLSLQRHPKPGEIAHLAGLLERPVHDFAASNEDLATVLALLSLLDNYVGVSNTNMHLIAGLGKIAHVLIPHPSPDWRWLMTEPFSPWFPGFPLYRQTPNYQWGPALQKLTAALQQAVISHHSIISSTTTQATMDIQTLLRTAQQHHQAGQFAQAEHWYRQILQSQPHQPDILHLLGVTLAQQGQLNEAVNYLKKAIEIKPYAPNYYTNLGNALRALGRLEEAIAQHRQALSFAPEDISIHNNLGVCLYEQGQLGEAERCFQTALDLNPTHGQAYNNLANIFSAQGQLSQAIEYYQNALLFDPHLIPAYLGLSDALQRNGQSQEAISILQQGQQLQPNAVQIILHLVKLWSQQGQLDEAIAVLKNAIEHQPQPDLYWWLGNIYYQVGDLDQAIVHYQQVLIMQFEHADAHHNLGVLLQQKGQLNIAKTHLEQSVQMRPNFAEAHHSLGNLLQIQNDLQGAESHYQQALQLTPQFAEVYNSLGSLYKTQSQLPKALQCFEQALSLNPNLANAHNNVAAIFQEQGQFAKAIQHYQQALSTRPQDADIYNNLSSVYRLQGDLTQALAYCEKAINLNPQATHFHYHRSIILLMSQRFAEGWQEYTWRPSRKINYAYLKMTPPPLVVLPNYLDQQHFYLYKEQGLGDELFFLRFAPLLKKRGGIISYHCSAKLASLLKRQPWLDKLILENQFELSALKGQVLLIGDLPAALGISHDIPPPLELTVLPEQLALMQLRLAKLGSPPYIGLTWRAGTSPEQQVKVREVYGQFYAEPHKIPISPYKSIPLQDLGMALQPLQATFLVLQRHIIPGELEILRGILGKNVHDLSGYNENLEEMLALLSLLNDYVTVSNTNIHLLAGLGKMARVLVPEVPEWRWMNTGEESPWFKGCKIYRQDTLKKDWSLALTSLTQDLLRQFAW